MAFNYTGMLKTASRLVRKFGGTFTYTAVVKGTYNPATRTQSGSSTAASVKGAFIGPGKTFIDGTVVQKGDGRFLLDAKGLTTTPTQGDTLRIKGIDYFVDAVRVVDPSGAKVVLYILELKAGSDGAGQTGA